MSKTEKAKNDNLSGVAFRSHRNTFSLTSSATEKFQRKVNQYSVILNHFWTVPMANKHHFKTFFHANASFSCGLAPRDDLWPQHYLLNFILTVAGEKNVGGINCRAWKTSMKAGPPWSQGAIIAFLLSHASDRWWGHQRHEVGNNILD